jgi:coenzyme F420-dependent glucose-6-phosphate dehydrogenase
MTRKVKISASPDVVEYPAKELLERAKRYEEAGFDTLWEGDHTLPWHHRGGHCTTATVMLEAFLSNTKKINAGFMVLSPIGIRNNPVDAALTCASMSNLHPGRISICVGTGEAMNERTTTGVWPSTRERIERLEEAINLMKKCWTSEDYFKFKGKYFKSFFYMYDKPPKPIPLYIAANGPNAAKLVGKYADGFVSINPPQFYKDVLFPIINKTAKENGRDPDQIERAAWVSTSYDPDWNKAIRGARNYGGLLIPECYSVVDDPRIIEARADLVRDEILAQVFTIATKPEDLINRLESYIKVGVNHLILAECSPNPDNTIEACKKIIPYIKETYPELSFS